MQTTVSTSAKAIAFFIGGAGDKVPYLKWGPTGIMEQIKDLVSERVQKQGLKDTCKCVYLGFDEVYGAENIKKHVTDMIPHPALPLYIIGASFGGWNGAHLSTLLSEQGYHVEMLITLDPVGKQAEPLPSKPQLSPFAFIKEIVSKVSLFYTGVYEGMPQPKANFWINICATPSTLNPSDYMTSVTNKWIMQTGPNINKNIDAHHDEVSKMFLTPLEGELSAADHICHSLEVCAKEVT
jgi:hypothetical protein